MAKEKKVITKSDWANSFIITGEARINDYTFNLDQHSEKSNWIYSSMNLGINCGEKNGTVYANMMGGYSADGSSYIYVHGKNDDGSDDFSNTFTVDYNDRFDKTILDSIGDRSFITVGLERTDKDRIFYNRFLSQYDAIAYIAEHLNDGDVVTVRGNIRYSTYNGETQINKDIVSIYISNVESDRYRASFTQSILINSDSASLKTIDKDKSVMYVDAIVLDYLKEYNGIEVKGQYPFHKTFEFPMDLTKPDLCKKVVDKLFKVKKNTVTQITFDGEFVEGGATVQATMDDVPDDIKDLIMLGIYTEEEALAKCTANGSREHRMLIVKPSVRLVGENRTPVLQVMKEKYKEDDLVLDYLYQYENDDVDEDAPFDDPIETSGDDALSWLDNLL